LRAIALSQPAFSARQRFEIRTAATISESRFVVNGPAAV
jgi:hypothetical protein